MLKLLCRRNSVHVTILDYSTSLVSCSSYLWFWAAWTPDGQLMVGRGYTVYEDPIMVYNDPSPLSISRFAVSSYYASSSSSWQLPLEFYTTS